MGENPLPGYGPVGSVNRLVRTRLLGGVGAGGEKPPATRLAFYVFCIINKFYISIFEYITFLKQSDSTWS